MDTKDDLDIASYMSEKSTDIEGVGNGGDGKFSMNPTWYSGKAYAQGPSFGRSGVTTSKTWLVFLVWNESGVVEARNPEGLG